MILAGIDEVGYGPVLGPLVVGAAAVRLPFEADAAAVPDVHALLRDVVADRRDRTGRRLHVADSKKVYSPSTKHGLRELEKSVLAFAAAAGVATDRLADVREPAEPWYAGGATERQPAEADAAGVAIATNALRHALSAADVAVMPPRAVMLFEREYNRRCDATRNKAAVQQSATAFLLDHLLATHAGSDGGLLVVLDRHGGRSHYGPFLRQMFEDWELRVLDESDERSDYELARPGGRAMLLFAEKAESLALPTALASMTAKYLRERFMHRFNAWWSARQPGLKATAGYWTDGQRWLVETSDLRRELGVEDTRLVRSR